MSSGVPREARSVDGTDLGLRPHRHAPCAGRRGARALRGALRGGRDPASERPRHARTPAPCWARCPGDATAHQDSSRSRRRRAASPRGGTADVVTCEYFEEVPTCAVASYLPFVQRANARAQFLYDHTCQPGCVKDPFLVQRIEWECQPGGENIVHVTTYFVLRCRVAYPRGGRSGCSPRSSWCWSSWLSSPCGFAPRVDVARSGCCSAPAGPCSWR